MHNIEDPFREETIDLKKIIKKYLYLWPWFLLSLAIAIGLVTYHNASKPNLYENRLTLLIHENEQLIKLYDIQNINSFNNSGTRINNEIEILTSRSLAYNTLQSLDFGIEYYRCDIFKEQLIYPNNYFTVEIDSSHAQAINAGFIISRNSNGTWQIKAEWDRAILYSFADESSKGNVNDISFKKEIKPNQWIEKPFFRFKIIENPNNLPPSSHEYKVVFRDIYSLVRRYRNIEVSEIGNSSILALNMQSESKAKNEVYLNMHAYKFLNRELYKKNKRAQNTIDFIDNQLEHVSMSLLTSEGNLKNFRLREQVVNIDFQTKRFFDRMDRLQQQKAELSIKEKYYQYLQNYLEQTDEDGSDLIAPSFLGIDDPLLSGLINELIDLYSERSELLINHSYDNPYLKNIISRIGIAKNKVKESLRNIIEANKMEMADLDYRINEVSANISHIPESKRELLSIERQFHLDEALYTFLQSKKSEIEITKAGFSPQNEIIDPALASDARLVSYSKKRNIYIAGIIGLLIPVLLIYVYEHFNDRVRSIEDIEKVGIYPLLGHIAHNTEKNNNLISFDDQSVVSESFRSLRTNTQFVLPQEQKPIVLITSTILEEGKSFVSLNMAQAQGSFENRVILVSMDLRKPKIHKYLGIDQPFGISNYLSSDIKPESIIHKSKTGNFDVIFSGQIPPNPTKLLASQKMNNLFCFLKDNYDYIIVDSPPVGMVSDALLLLKHVNVVIYLVRHNKVPYKYLEYTLKKLKEKNIQNINIVLNDIPQSGGFNYQYYYGYKYGYNHKSKVSKKRKNT